MDQSSDPRSSQAPNAASPAASATSSPSAAATPQSSAYQYSDNRKTVAGRKRKAEMTEERNALDNKRRAENQAKYRARAQAKKKALLDNASEAEQQERVAQAESSIMNKRAKRDEASSASVRHQAEEFYRRAAVEAQKASKKDVSQGSWVNIADDHIVFEENEQLLRISEPRQAAQAAIFGGNTDEEKEEVVKKYRVRQSGQLNNSDWIYFRDFWNRQITSFWRNVYVLEHEQLATDSVVELNKATLKFVHLQRSSFTKPGVRPEVRPNGVLFKAGKYHHGSFKPPRHRVHFRWRLCRRGSPEASRKPPKATNKACSPDARLFVYLARAQKSIRPHHLFTLYERVIFRLLAPWSKSFNRGNQFQFPGPACFWPDDYDYFGHGFKPEDDQDAARSIYEFIRGNMGKEEVPQQFSCMLKSDTELRWKKHGELDPFDIDW